MDSPSNPSGAQDLGDELRRNLTAATHAAIGPDAEVEFSEPFGANPVACEVSGQPGRRTVLSTQLRIDGVIGVSDLAQRTIEALRTAGFVITTYQQERLQGWSEATKDGLHISVQYGRTSVSLSGRTRCVPIA
jgi:hypothetical protein